jgi:hypothetical protein
VDALSHRSATLKDERPITGGGEEVSWNEARWTRTYNDGALFKAQRPRRRQPERLLRVTVNANLALVALSSCKEAILVREWRDLGGVDEVEVAFLARVQALAEDTPGTEVTRRNA